MSSPDTPAFRMSSAAAASPPNPPPTICALMAFSLDLTAAKLRVEEPLRLFVAYASESDVAGRFRRLFAVCARPREYLLSRIEDIAMADGGARSAGGDAVDRPTTAPSSAIARQRRRRILKKP